MEYTLENLHRLIQGMSPEVIKPAALTQDKINNWLVIATEERSNIQVHLMKDIFNIQHEKTLEIYVATCQSTLIGFADNLTAYSKQINKKSKLTGLYQDMIFIIDSILTFIELHFSKYFNLDAKVPEAYYQVAQNEMKRKMESLVESMSKVEIDKPLFEIALQPLTDFANEKKSNGITYRKLIYLKELLQEFKIFAGNETNVKDTAEFINLLFYLNFNHALFFNYFINWVCTEVEQINSISERIEKFYIV